MKKHPNKKVELDKLLEPCAATHSANRGTGKHNTSVVEPPSPAIRMALDKKSAVFVTSSRIAHKTKSKIELGVAGKRRSVGGIKVWNVEADLT